MNPQDVPILKSQIAGMSPQESIEWFLKEFGNKIALSNSMGLEDQVLTDMICKIDKSTKIFTLDTGRIFPETYDLIGPN
jgi:phosphoadenosine phosphosulfate reductase